MSTAHEIQFRDAATRAARASEELPDVQGERMVLNMGPSHPSTHGVLRVVLELDGEVITKATPHVGYLHRGDEKIAENMGYGRGRTGSVSPKFQAASTKSFFTIRTNGDLQINQQWHDHQDAGERAGFFRDEFVRLLRAGGLAVPDGPYPRLKASEWTAKSDLLAETTRKLFGSGR